MTPEIRALVSMICEPTTMPHGHTRSKIIGIAGVRLRHRPRSSHGSIGGLGLTAPRYLVRDNDRAFGAAFEGSRSGDGHPGPADVVPVAVENGHVERLIGSIRRECTDHMIVFNEDLRRILSKYASL
jgi:hypothetical protein